VSAQPQHAVQPDEIVPVGLRTYLRWDERHDAAAETVMREYGFALPCDRELLRHLAVTRVMWGRWRGQRETCALLSPSITPTCRGRGCLPCQWESVFLSACAKSKTG
jgi:hypothetical protein